MVTPASIDPSRTDAVDAFLRDQLQDAEIPGLSLAVVSDGELVYATGYGSRDLSSNAPATADTVYGIGSVSKSFTALALLQLADDGLLSVDDPVTDHLDVDVPEEVTLHHLLTHTSGYPSLAVSEALIARQMGVGEACVPLGSRDDLHANLAGARDEIAGEPGERWMYCNTGYTLLGEVVEAASGTPFTEYVAREILTPLEMTRSTYDGERFPSFDDRMTPYRTTDDGPEASTLPVREHSTAAGGLLSPVTDLAKYLQLHLAGGTFEGQRLVSKEALESGYEGYAETPAGPYGYGWRTREVCGHELIGHGGSIAVSSAYVGFCRDERLGIALLANTSPAPGLAEFGVGVFAALVGDDPYELPYFARTRRLEELSGEYESYRGIKQATVEREGGMLRLRIGDPLDEGTWTPLVPENLDRGEFFTLTAAGDRQDVTFERDGDDLSLYIDRWRLHQR